MSKKALIIVGLAVAIAAATGVYFAGSSLNTRGANSDPLTDTSSSIDTSSASNGADAIAAEATDYDVVEAPTTDIDNNDEQTEVEQASVDNSNSTAIDSDSELVLSADTITGYLTISKVIDHTTGREQSPRVVFGTSYSDCYLRFDASGSCALYVNPSSGEVQKGTYHIYDNIISVLYDSGIGTEYTLFTAADGSIDYIIVNSGDYDIYFS